MSEEREAELISLAAAERGVPADLLMKLLAVEREIPEVNAWGARAQLVRRVAEILDGTLRQEKPL